MNKWRNFSRKCLVNLCKFLSVLSNLCKLLSLFISAGRGGRKLDDVRDKYQKACRKLHLTHNEYVLLLCEAVEFEKDFRTVLLPGLLEYQQSLQEAFISTWWAIHAIYSYNNKVLIYLVSYCCRKQILQDVASNSDLTSEKFREIQRKVESNIDSIKPCDEYKDFTERNKWVFT